MYEHFQDNSQSDSYSKPVRIGTVISAFKKKCKITQSYLAVNNHQKAHSDNPDQIP